MAMAYSYTILYVNDVVSSMNFYEAVFDLKRKLLTPEQDYGELCTGSTTLAFATHKLANSNLTQGFQATCIHEKPHGIELGFVVDSVEQTLNQALVHGALLYEPEIQKPWGQTVAYIRDGNGFLIEICTQIPQES